MNVQLESVLGSQTENVSIRFQTFGKPNKMLP